MSIIVQSRFAGLKIDDDDEIKRKSNKKQKNSTASNGKKTEPTKKIETNKVQKSSKNQGESQQNKKKKKKPTAAQQEQWENWKQKDSELVDEHYVEDLEKALLLSKLDFERMKVESKQKKQEVIQTEECSVSIDESAKGDSKSKKKNKNKKVMSLDEFNDLGKKVEEVLEDDNVTVTNGSPRKKQSIKEEKSIFDSVEQDLKNEIMKEKCEDSFRQRQLMSDEVMSRIQFLETIEQKDKEIAELRVEVEKLKDDLQTVKNRNRKLCHILGQGEMKDKAEILIEVEKLRSVQDELTREVSILNAQLQQERSAKGSDFKQKKKQNSTDKEK